MTTLLTIPYIFILVIGIIRLTIIYLNQDCKKCLDVVPYPDFGLSMKFDIIALTSITVLFIIWRLLV